MQKPQKPQIKTWECVYNALDFGSGHFSILKDGSTKEPTHIGLSVKDWETLQKYMYDLRSCIDEAEQDIEESKQDISRQVKNIKYKANEKIQEWEAYAKQCQDERDEAIALNTTLKRICKERANADRKLRPKKKHHGYIPIRQEEVTLGKEAKWRTLVETPYDTFLTPDQADKLIRDDIQNEVFFKFDENDRYTMQLIRQFQSKYYNVRIESNQPFEMEYINQNEQEE